MFKDEAEIRVRAGDGGRGCISFRREKFVARGGPNGGDGGAGGDVWVVASNSLNTLYHLHFNKEWKGERGEHGMGSNCSGRAGADETIELPVGSVVRDSETRMVLADLTENGQRVMVAKGGRGGQGNQHFASATRQSPRFAQPGEEGEEKRLFIELKLIADVGIVGFPNAGKSTLISVISAAKPKIADYPFTTLIPNLGVVSAGSDTFVVADIPGIIEGAHEGHGLGVRFLKHVERCALLIHLVDLSQSDDPRGEAEIIERELAHYSEMLGNKKRILCGSKLDSAVDGASANLRGYANERGYPYVEISAVVGTGIEALKFSLAEMVREIRREEIESADAAV
ncbi:MAG: GTPase ObgE [Thermoanaerobaculia bacterium]|jgi:GTP-binding protein